MSKVLMLSLASLAAAIALSALPGQAAPAENALLHEAQYIDRYNRHRLHHGPCPRQSASAPSRLQMAWQS